MTVTRFRITWSMIVAYAIAIAFGMAIAFVGGVWLLAIIGQRMAR